MTSRLSRARAEPKRALRVQAPLSAPRAPRGAAAHALRRTTGAPQGLAQTRRLRGEDPQPCSTGSRFKRHQSPRASLLAPPRTTRPRRSAHDCATRRAPLRAPPEPRTDEPLIGPLSRAKVLTPRRSTSRFLDRRRRTPSALLRKARPTPHAGTRDTRPATLTSGHACVPHYFATLRRHRAQSSRTSRSRADHDWTPLRTPLSLRQTCRSSAYQTASKPDAWAIERVVDRPTAAEDSANTDSRRTPAYPPKLRGAERMCCAHELRRRPPTDASRAGRNRAARHRPSHASSKLTPTRSTSRFLDRLRRSTTDGSCRLHGHQTIRRDAQGRLEPRLPDAPLGDILGCVKTDAEAVDLTLSPTASGGRFSSPADDAFRAGFLPPPRLPGFPTQPPGLPSSPRASLFQTNARQAPRFAWRGAVIPARSSAARLTHPRLTSRTTPPPVHTSVM